MKVETIYLFVKFSIRVKYQYTTFVLNTKYAKHRYMYLLQWIKKILTLLYFEIEERLNFLVQLTVANGSTQIA